MMVRLAEERDFPGFLGLAGQVEHWFGPMVEDAGFHEAVREHIRRGAALVAVAPDPDTDAARVQVRARSCSVGSCSARTRTRTRRSTTSTGWSCPGRPARAASAVR